MVFPVSILPQMYYDYFDTECFKLIYSKYMKMQVKFVVSFNWMDEANVSPASCWERLEIWQ